MEDEDSSISNRGVKRRAEYELADIASKSLTIDNANSAVGILAIGNPTINCGNITVIQNQITKHNEYEHKVCGITFQMADPIPTFHGRHEEFEIVKKTFEESNNGKQYNLVAICGYGGIGKSEFARKYIKQNQSNFENVIWIYAEFEANIRDNFSNLKKILSDRGYDCYKEQDVYKYLNSTRCIFIFDNVEDMKSIRLFLPDTTNESLFLITSQLTKWNPYVSVNLGTLDLENATSIVQSVFNMYEVEISDSELLQLVNNCEPIPLVLQIVTGFVCQQVIDLKDIGQKYNIKHIIKKLENECNLVTEEFPCFSTDQYSKSIFEAVSRTLHKIWGKNDAISNLAADMLGISAYLNADDIEDTMLKLLLKTDNTKTFNKSLATLTHYSLFQVSNRPYLDTIQISMHRTIQECIRHHYREISCTKYYSGSLPTLLQERHRYRLHHKAIFLHGEKNLETFYNFYIKNKCCTLFAIIAFSATVKILLHLFYKSDLLKLPEFLCEAAVCERKDINLKKLLQDNNADFTIKNDEGFNVVYYACLRENDNPYIYDRDLFRLWHRISSVIANGANINQPNNYGDTILHLLCNMAQHDPQQDKYIFHASALLCRKGADAKIMNNSGQTPANLSEKYGLILSHGLFNLVTLGGENISHITIRYNQIEFFRWLRQKNICDIDEQDNFGCTILHILCSLDTKDDEYETEIFNNTLFLVAHHEADVTTANDLGETAEVTARRFGRKRLSQFLHSWIPFTRNVYELCKNEIDHFPYVHSKHKKDIDYQDECGNTLLHIICGLRESNIEEDVLKFAADLVISWARADIKNVSGDTAVTLCRRRNRPLLADFLELASSKPEHFMQVAFKHMKFDLIEYAWWRYRCATEYDLMYGIPGYSGCFLLYMLCDSEKESVSDSELIRIMDNLDLKQVAQYENEIYHEAVERAKHFGRHELSEWLLRFPADAERRKRWIINCKRKNWDPTQNDRLCTNHFQENQFENKRADGKKRLLPFAVPTIFNVSNPPALVDISRKSLYKRPREENNSNSSNVSKRLKCDVLDLPPDSTNSKLSLPVINRFDDSSLFSQVESLSKCEDNSVETNNDLIKEISDLKKKISTLENELKLKNEAIGKCLTPEQFNTLSTEKKCIKSWSSEGVVKSLKLRFALGKNGYNYLRETGYPAPSYSTLNRRISSVKLQFGLLHSIIDLLAKKVETMTEIEKDCSVMVDEMEISGDVDFDKSKKAFIGQVTLGDTSKRGTHLTVVALRGLNTPWKQIIACHVTGPSTNGNDMKTLILQVIEAAASVGLKVRSVCSDMGSNNKALWASLGVSVTRDQRVTNFKTELNEDIYAIADGPHLLKNWKAAIQKSKIYIPMEIAIENNLPTNVIDGKYISDLWNKEIDNGKQLRLLHHITDEIIAPSHFSKMNVGCFGDSCYTENLTSSSINYSMVFKVASTVV